MHVFNVYGDEMDVDGVIFPLEAWSVELWTGKVRQRLGHAASACFYSAVGDVRYTRHAFEFPSCRVDVYWQCDNRSSRRFLDKTCIFINDE